MEGGRDVLREHGVRGLAVEGCRAQNANGGVAAGVVRVRVVVNGHTLLLWQRTDSHRCQHVEDLRLAMGVNGGRQARVIAATQTRAGLM